MSNEKNEQKPFIYETFLNQKRLTKNDYYEYKKQNKKYTDELYPANDHSIYSQNSKGEFNDKKNGQKLKDELEEDLELKEKKLTIEWERISDRGDFKQIYNEKISHEQIEQGSLGNCYLMSLIASISHFPKLIIGEKDKNTPHLLFNIEYGDIGYYEIMFFIDGNFKIIIIDDYIPFFKESGNTVFGKSSENCYWVNLVEKAYSKICGGYTSMNVDENKNTYDHFQVFTGYKCERFTLYDEENDKFIINKNEINHIFKIIEENLKNENKKFNIIITTGTPDENKGILLEENYMPYKHSFSILDSKIIKINKDKDEMKLLLINNPWGRNVYDGGLGKYCLENLNDDVINLKPYIENNLNSEDGTFWIDYDTFVKNYISINVCKIPCNYHCINYSLSKNQFFELPFIYKLNIDKKTNIWLNININESNSIINHNDKIKIFKFIIISQINNEGKIIKCFSETKGSDDLQINYDLEKGNYLIWLYIPKKYSCGISDLKANFIVSSDNKIKIKFINFDKDFNCIINICEYLFNINNEIQINEKEDKLIKCSVDCKSINGFLILFFKNNTKDKKIEAEPETNVEGFKPIKDEENIDLTKLKFTLMPEEKIYFVGISAALKSKFSVGGINLNYYECHSDKIENKIYNFLDYINEKNLIDEKFTINKYETNSYCFIKTNFNKNKDQRDEENVFNFFLNLMIQKMKFKGLKEDKIKLISINLWNKMKEEEKEKIREKYDIKKKELKNNVLKTQVLKYIKRNSIKIKDKNKIDNEIQNMQLKTKLSKEIQIAKFEDDLDELEIHIKNILPKIEYLKETEKDEIELDEYIIKQNSISEELKKLLKEKITIKNAKQIDEQKCKLSQEYLLFSEKMSKYLKKHEEKMKLYNEINEKGKKISDEINAKIKIYNEKKLDLKKEVNNLIKRFQELGEEAKKLKLIEIHKKCDNNVIKKQKEIFADIDKIQNELKSIADNIKKNNEENKKKQDEILTNEINDKLTKMQSNLTIELNKFKDTSKEYDDIIGLINEEQKFIKELETLNNNINENNLKESCDNYNNFNEARQKIGEKINNFQQKFIPKINSFSAFVKGNEECKKEILDIYEKFKEQKLQINESLDKLLSKTKELLDNTKNLKIMEIFNKIKEELKPNWEKIESLSKNIANNFKTLIDKKGEKPIQSNQTEISNIDNKKIKEISEKVNKEMEPLEEKQKYLINTFDNLKKEKSQILNEINNLYEEQNNSMKEIKVIYKNDINNINIQNIKDNFEKYKNFNEKYREFSGKMKTIANKCNEFINSSFNTFVDQEFENRKKIFENANILSENGVAIDQKNEKIIKNAEELVNEIKQFNIKEVNEKFNKLNNKIKELREVVEAIAKILAKK